jgi:hypothetical protein
MMKEMKLFYQRETNTSDFFRKGDNGIIESVELKGKISLKL